MNQENIESEVEQILTSNGYDPGIHMGGLFLMDADDELNLIVNLEDRFHISVDDDFYNLNFPGMEYYTGETDGVCYYEDRAYHLPDVVKYITNKLVA